jgi:hypothetical protein
MGVKLSEHIYTGFDKLLICHTITITLKNDLSGTKLERKSYKPEEPFFGHFLLDILEHQILLSAVSLILLF